MVVAAATDALPTELWANVFAQLSMRDRFSVTRVSQRWRSIALGAPMLWTDIDYYASTHSVTCTCKACQDDPPEPACQSCGRRVPAELDNISMVRTLLSRSDTQPLRVAVTVYGEADVEAIRGVLASEQHRIASLHLTLDDSGHSIEFFNAFRTFDILRDLAIITEVEQEEEDPFVVFGPNIKAPALLRLEVEGAYMLNSASQFHNVQFARVPFTRHTDILATLTAFPGASSIHWQISDEPLDEPAPETIKLLVREHLRRSSLDCIEVSDIYHSDTENLLQLLQCKDVPKFRLSFRLDAEVSIEPFAVFADLGPPVLIDWRAVSGLDSEDNTLMTLRATADGDRERRVAYCEENLVDADDDEIWGSFESFHILEKLVLDAPIWTGLSDSTFADFDMPTLRELVLEFRDDHEDVVVPALVRLAKVRPRLPQLETVRLVLKRRDPDEDMVPHSTEFAQSVSRILSEASINKAATVKIKHLELAGLQFLPSTEPLHFLAESFS